MLMVLAIAMFLGATLPAIEVIRERDFDFHVHTWVNPNGGANLAPGRPIRPDQMPVTLSQVEMRSTPFWPRYWRCLLGRPWRGQPFCDPDPTRLVEACEHAYPGMVKWRKDRSFDIEWSTQTLAGRRTIVPSVTSPGPSPPRSPKAP
jgi:hypothetical protein